MRNSHPNGMIPSHPTLDSMSPFSYNLHMTKEEKRQSKTEYKRKWRAMRKTLGLPLANVEKMRIDHKNHHKRFRTRILEFFGTRCSVCGFDDFRALQVDHVNGGGSKEWKGKSYGKRLAMIKANPQNYQLLCANHNWIKKYERGEVKGS